MKNFRIVSYLYFVVFIAITQTSCDELAAGPFPYSELYKIHTDEETLLSAIQKFRIENPKYNLPASVELKDGPVNDEDYFHHLYFYYPEESKIVKCWIRTDVVDKNKTIFGFVAINFGSGFGNWKEINHDFDSDTNEKEKQQFRNLILNKILKNLFEPRLLRSAK